MTKWQWAGIGLALLGGFTIAIPWWSGFSVGFTVAAVIVDMGHR